MARRRNKNTGKLLVLLGLGVGGYLLWKTGTLAKLWENVTTPGSTTPSGNDYQQAANGDGTTGGTAQLVGTIGELGTALASLFSRQDQEIDNQQMIDPPSTIPPAIQETIGSGAITEGAAVAAGLTLPGWLGGVPEGGATLPASRIPELILKSTVPVFIGTSKAVAEAVHDVNVATGGTGLQKNFMTFTAFSTKPGGYRGAFQLDSETGNCYDLAGRKITCPTGEDIVGIEAHTLNWYKDVAG